MNHVTSLGRRMMSRDSSTRPLNNFAHRPDIGLLYPAPLSALESVIPRQFSDGLRNRPASQQHKAGNPPPAPPPSSLPI